MPLETIPEPVALIPERAGWDEVQILEGPPGLGRLASRASLGGFHGNLESTTIPYTCSTSLHAPPISCNAGLTPGLTSK